ncbi:zinc finger protein 804B [Bombina bombina]|uniref:zinc finger protein 804B n=1 Tax=Bombina bombina TaxID=8345 RepID=UPI00235A4B94|nr:zinc finger protein 804B [Bombina bombina]
MSETSEVMDMLGCNEIIQNFINGSEYIDELGYAEKGKSIANALEDLKANFYCELCDKQYHKHQEFENHINSYDHAHKQRLKELKQREFARNVASKSWKDEKKQEKALKRLHELAELRKQQDCVTDGNSIFKTPRLQGPQETFFTSKDSRINGSSCTVLCKGETVSNSSISEEKQDILFGTNVLNNGRCCFVGNQTKLPFANGINVNNRAGVSFCFSKKALLKLESSASVFNENTEEVNEGTQFLNHKAKQMSVSFRHYAHMEENTRDASPLALQHETENSMQGEMPANVKILKDTNSSEDITKETNEIDQSNVNVETLSFDLNDSETLNETEDANNSLKPEETLEASETIHYPDTHCDKQDDSLNEHIVPESKLTDHLSDNLKQTNTEDDLSDNSNIEPLDSSIEASKNPTACQEPPIAEPLNDNTQCKAMPFLNVLSKDGSTNLQWPTELLLFTKTEPSISYACNPLYFDFKCSRKDRIRKANERTKTSEDQDKSKTTKEKKASGINTDGELQIEKDSQSSEPKRENLLLEEMPEKVCESFNNYGITKEIIQKASLYNLHENAAHVPSHLSASQKSMFKERNYSTKRKRSFYDMSDNSKDSLDNRVNKYNFLSKEASKNKHHKSLHDYQLNIKDTGDRICCNSPNQSQNKTSPNVNENEKDIPWDLSSYSSSSNNKESDIESDGSTVKSWRSSSSQISPSHKVFLHSDSSISGNLTCKQDSFNSHKESHNTNMRGNCLRRKHKYDTLTGIEHTSYISDKRQKSRCRYLKHKTLTDIPKCETPNHHLCSQYIRTEHRYKKKYKSIIHKIPHSREASIGENPTSIRTDLNNTRVFSKERTFIIGEHTGDTFNTSEARKASYKCYSQNIIALSGNCSNRTSENIVKHIIVNEKKTLIAKLLLERGLTQEEEENKLTSRDCTTGGGIELKSPSQSYFEVKFPHSSHCPSILPMLENVTSSSKRNSYGTDHIKEHGFSNSKTDGTQGYGVTVTTNTDKCIFKDIIHVDTECRTLNNETPVSVGEQSRQLITEVKPFMQSSDPIHLNFSCALPSLPHSGGTKSSETKDQPERLGLHDVTMKSSPVEGNVKCCYDSTMQDLSRIESNHKLYHKPTSPPLTQQPITFSPEEVDKYRLLQLQAQQHMQKQHLSMHFKVLPSNGSSVFPNTQTLQPVQHHPSITTIHHALMQRYAVTAAMHSQPNHLPVPHLNPFPQSHFSPIISSLAPTIIPTHPAFIAGHPLHLVSATAIHPTQLTIQAFPHTALIPTLLAPHPNTAIHPAIHIHPLIHPLFQGQEYHQYTSNQPH